MPFSIYIGPWLNKVIVFIGGSLHVFYSDEVAVPHHLIPSNLQIPSPSRHSRPSAAECVSIE